jgi:hypothetical protein
LEITCQWLKQDKQPIVNVHTDFGVDFEAGTELDALQKAQASGVISKRLQFDEMKRRGVLADDADWEDDQQQSRWASRRSNWPSSSRACSPRR